MIIAILWVTSAAVSAAGSADTCYWSAACPYKYFSSKTPYDDVRADVRDAPPYTGCDAVSVWMLARHGARHPGDDDTDAMRRVASLRTSILDAHRQRRGHLCQQDIEDLTDWEWNESLDNTTSHLTGRGSRELRGLGRRLRAAYPRLVVGGSLYFRPTDEQRTVVSARAFVQGLTEGTDTGVTLDRPRAEDVVIRPYKMCPLYEKLRNTSPTPYDHVKEFHRTPEFQQMISDVKKRVGLDEELTSENVTALYNLCRFYRSFEPNERSPWCSIFSDDNLATLEYLDDVMHYYKNGYGADINCKLGATALKDLYEKFEATYSGSGEPRRTVVGYFTHDTMMEMVFCALGLFKDDAGLTGTSRTDSRRWRTSVMTPFASNFVAVLHKCGRDHAVRFFINEREVALCGGGRACPWGSFTHKFRPYANATLDFCAPGAERLP